MPISDGYEACRNIVNLYADNNQLFKMNKKNESPLNQNPESNILAKKERPCDHLQNIDLTPIIIACTSDIINENLIKKLTDLGFNGWYEAPVSEEVINSEIIPLLLVRAVKLNRKNEILKIIKESVESHSFESISNSMSKQSMPNIFSQNNSKMF